MKVLMVLEHDFPEDIRVEREAVSLINFGHEVSIATCNKSHINTILNYKNIKIFKKHIPNIVYKSSALALSLPFYFLFWYNYLKTILKEEKYDVVHIHDLPLMKVGFLLRKKFNFKLVGDFHENRPEIMKYYQHTNTLLGRLLISIKKWQRYQVDSCQNSDYLILVTNEAKSYYVKNYGVNPEKIFVVPNFPNLDELDKINKYTPKQESYEDLFMIVYFGDTSLRRGTKDIILAAKMLEKDASIKFLIIGYNNKEQKILENIIKKLNVKNVTLTGYKPMSEAVSYFKAASAGICPIHRNIHHDTTFANKIFQYMYFELPVIVSDCPPQQNVIETWNTGLVFESENTEELVQQILKLKNSTDYRQMCLNAKKSVIKDYNWDNASIELKNLYTQIDN